MRLKGKLDFVQQAIVDRHAPLVEAATLMLREGQSLRHISRTIQISRPTLYKWLRQGRLPSPTAPEAP